VRGFLAGVVRKKLGLNLVSEPGESGRVHRIVNDMASRAKRRPASTRRQRRQQAKAR